MTSYRVSAGHDVILGSLTVLDPQPDPGPGIQTTRRTYGGDHTVNDQGRYIELEWSAYTTDVAYRTLIGLFGLNDATSSALVTVYVRDETYNWVRMNGTAIRPIPGQTVKWGDDQPRPLNITILIKNLETVA
jgi:hypothetical protein